MLWSGGGKCVLPLRAIFCGLCPFHPSVHLLKSHNQAHWPSAALSSPGQGPPPSGCLFSFLSSLVLGSRSGPHSAPAPLPVSSYDSFPKTYNTIRGLSTAVQKNLLTCSRGGFTTAQHGNSLSFFLFLFFFWGLADMEKKISKRVRTNC